MGNILHHGAGARAEQPRADAADGLTSNRSFTEGSNMSDETKPAPLWERTKAWADKNRTISGALVGGAAGTIVPGLGTVIGAIVGAGIGFASSKEKKDDRPS
ncbi:MAG: glycine zipper domain-containing protein [Xanthobacteraceae bacterium]